MKSEKYLKKENKTEKTSKGTPGAKMKFGEKKKRVTLMIAPVHMEAIKKDYVGVSDFVEIHAEKLMKSQKKTAVVILFMLLSLASCTKSKSNPTPANAAKSTSSCFMCVTKVTHSAATWIGNTPHGYVYSLDSAMVCDTPLNKIHIYEEQHSTDVVAGDSLIITNVTCHL